MLKWAAAAWWSTTYQDDAALSASKEEIWRIWRKKIIKFKNVSIDSKFVSPKLLAYDNSLDSGYSKI